MDERVSVSEGSGCEGVVDARVDVLPVVGGVARLLGHESEHFHEFSAYRDKNA